MASDTTRPSTRRPTKAPTPPPENGVHLSAAEFERRYDARAPELVAEVAASSASFDLHEKLDAHRRLRDGRFEPRPPGEDGLLRSEAFPGLWLDRDALLRGDLARVLAVARRGVQSPEHAAFVERLRQSAARTAGGQGGPRP
jgi:hypothetical protein